MNRFLPHALIVLILLTISACKQANPNPEQLDPIYKDLEARAAAHQKGYEESKAKLAESIASLAKAEPNSVEKKEATKELEKVRVKVLDEEQWAHYYKIRVARRLAEDKVNYAKAFDEDKVWPDAAEYRDYQLNRRLVESPRNWNLRVPKMPTRAAASETKPKAKAEAKEE